MQVDLDSLRSIPNQPFLLVEHYKLPAGWTCPQQREARARACCELLESGKILFFRELPFHFPVEDRAFLVGQEWAELRLQKNISYSPDEDVLRGVSAGAGTVERLHTILRNYSTQVAEFVKRFLLSYAVKLVLDFASFHPFEEERRGVPLQRRNDLLHVDASPSQPTRGARILRVFTNLNPTKPSVWSTAEPFESLARKHAEAAGLRQVAEDGSFSSRTVEGWGAELGFAGFGRTPYDMFMLRFHDYLKENREFQENSPKTRCEFPPFSTWLVFTDGVAHAVMSGQYVIEQTFLIRPEALVAPQHAPLQILESMAELPLVS
jgi:hypothetical protein